MHWATDGPGTELINGCGLSILFLVPNTSKGGESFMIADLK